MESRKDYPTDQTILDILIIHFDYPVIMIKSY